MEEKQYILEFVEDTVAGALVWHSAPYTGCVEVVVPKGTRAYLERKMNPANHHFCPLEGYYTDEWIKGILEKAKAVSPIPERVNGGLSFFISIRKLLGGTVVFLPSEGNSGDPETALRKLREEYRQARQCALMEESKSFRELVRKGLCHPMMDESDRKEILGDDMPDNPTSSE